MAINRYNKPIRSDIMSQYVPLPIAEMAEVLAMKQGQYDQQAAEVAAYQDAVLKMKALEGRDTEYVKGVRNQFDDFVTSIENEDLTNPEVRKRIKRQVQSIAGDDNLNKIQGAVAHHDAFTKRWQELKKKNEHAAADALAWEYQKSFGEYTKQGGRGFEGPGLSDYNINEGVDKLAETKKYFDMLKADGYTRDILDKGIVYKDGWRGVDGKKITAHASNIIENVMTAPLGRQLEAEYNMTADQNGKPRNETEKRNYIMRNLLTVGAGFAHEETQFGIDPSASDFLYRRAKEEEEKNKKNLGELAFKKNANLELDEDGDLPDLGRETDFWDDFAMFWMGQGSVSKLFDSKDGKLTAEAQTQVKAFDYAVDKSGLSRQEFVEKLNGDDSFVFDRMTEKEMKSEAERLARDYKTITLIDSETGVSLNGADVVKGDEKSSQEIAEKFAVIGNIKPNNYLAPKGRVVMVHGKIYIEDDSKNATAAERDLSKAYGALRPENKGTVTFVSEENGRLVRSRFTGDPQNPIEFEYIDPL